MPFNTPEKQKAYNDKYYAENRQKFLDRNRNNRPHINKQRKAYRLLKPEWQLVRSARARAKKFGLKCTIEESDIIIPELCPILGIKLQISEGKPTDHSPTLDRKDNSKGYTPDNICVISYRANRLKSDATAEELEAILDYMRKE